MTEENHREAISYYYGLVSQIDYNIGRVLDHLVALGIDDDTVVVFTSDHGEFGAEMACWKKGGGMYDNLTRVPLVIRTPGQVVADHVADVTTASSDLFPTLVELLGLTPTPNERARLDGRSLAEIALTGEVPSDWPEETFSEFGPTGGEQAWMVATAVDKYVFDEEGGGAEEYFDLVVDPWEMDNRIGDPVVLPRIDELRSKLATWWGDEADHAPNYLVTGDHDAAPAHVENPVPEDDATKVKIRTDPSWLPATSAATQEVFLGTAPNQLELFASLPAMADHFNPGTLAKNTTFYWRVDGINAHGVTLGPVWSFTTRKKGRTGPGLTHSPSPAGESPGVPRDVVLSWKSGEGTMAHDVWFGLKDQPLARVIRGMPTVRYAPGELLGGRTYVWRVDSLDTNGKTVGDEWTFTVDATGLPEPAGIPYPEHLASDMTFAVGETLLWSGGAGAVEHDVYFGTDFPLAYQGRQGAAAFDPGALDRDTTYYWRIDEVNDAGVRTGLTWRFKTKD